MYKRRFSCRWRCGGSEVANKVGPELQVATGIMIIDEVTSSRQAGEKIKRHVQPECKRGLRLEKTKPCETEAVQKVD